METLTIHQTKTNLSALLKKVDKGQVVTFGARGQASYRIIKTAPAQLDRSEIRGILKGKIVDRGAFTPEADAEIWKDFDIDEDY